MLFDPMHAWREVVVREQRTAVDSRMWCETYSRGHTQTMIGSCWS